MSVGEAVSDSVWEGRDPHQIAKEVIGTAQELIAAGRSEAAYELLREAMRVASVERIDTSDIQYWAAQALLAGRHFPQAAELLGRLAEERPDLDRVLIDYAAVLFALGRDDESEAVFRDINRKQDLPISVRRRVMNFLERIRGRQRLKINWDLGFWRDNNVSNAPELDTVEIPAFGGLRFTLDQRPVRAWVARTGVRFRWSRPVSGNGNASFETRGSATRDTVIGASEYNRTYASVSAGPRVHFASRIGDRPRPGLFRADLGVERRWRGGGGYATGVWSGFVLEQTFSRNWHVGISPQVWVTRYDVGAEDDRPWGRSFGLYFSRRIGTGWLTATSKVSRETPDWATLRWASREVSLRFARDIGQDWNVTVRGGLAKTQFEGEDPLFGRRREDRTYRIGVTTSYRVLRWGGYLPELTLNWSRTSSSIPLYDRERFIFQLGLRRLF